MPDLRALRPGDIAAYGWAVQRPDGEVIVDTRADVDEHKIWVIALGWPSEDEISRAQEDGARAFRCKVVLIDAPNTAPDFCT